MTRIFKSTFKERFISHIKPCKYRDKATGKYKIGYWNIKFIPVYNTHITDAIHAMIDISNKHEMEVYAVFNGVPVYVPYPTNHDDATIQNIVDTYHSRQTELQKILDKKYVKA